MLLLFTIVFLNIKMFENGMLNKRRVKFFNAKFYLYNKYKSYLQIMVK